MKYTPDYSSRFRILKGGKISLVVSALLVGSSMIVPVAHAQDVTGNSTQTITLTSTDSINVIDPGITVTDSSALVVGGATYTATITNSSAIDVSGNYANAISGIQAEQLANGSTITNNTAKTISVINTGTGDVNGITTKTSIPNGGDLIGASSIVNNGTITVEGAGLFAEGIFVDGNLYGASSVLNTESISVTGTGSTTNAYGIDVGGIVKGSTITNSGTIDVTSINGIGIYAGSLANDGATRSVITNAATKSIDVTANTRGVGIEVYGTPADGYLTMKNSDITNAGTISVTLNANVELANVTAYGIHVNPDDFMVKDSTITNSGSINVLSNFAAYEVGDVRLSGIEVNNAEIDGLTITNSGAISIANAITGSYDNVYRGSSYVNGIETRGSAATRVSITNSGTGDTNGIHIDTYSEARGINVETFDNINSNINTTITNSGTIDIKSNQEAYGIRVYGDFDSTTEYMRGLQITNSGTISAVSRYSDSYGISANVLGSTYDGETNNASFITNSSTISATANSTSGGDAYGIRVGLMSDDSLITNSGTIAAISLGNGGRAFGIDVNTMSGTSQITNTLGHSITVNGSERGIGISVGREMTESSFISNAGTITVNSVSEANGMDISQMSGTTSIANSGIINVNNSDSESSYNATGITVWDADASAGITNSGTIRATVGGTMDEYGAIVDGVMSASAFSVYSTGGGTLFNLSNGKMYDKMYGKMYGNLKYMGTVNNYGTISLPHNANGDLSATVGTFVNKSTGILEIGLQTDGTTTTHSQLATTDATFEDGSTIYVNVLAASTNVGLLVGETLEDVVSASNSLTIDGTLKIDDNSELLAFEYVEDGETIDLNIVEGTTIFDSTVAGGGTTNAQSAASALQAIQDAGVPEGMSGFYEALGGLTTDEEVAAAVESTTPATVGAVSTANSQIMNGIQGIVEMRQNNVLGGMNSGDMSLTDKNLWAKVYGSRGNQDDKDGVRGFDVKAFGLGIGADAEIAPRSRIGAALFYTDADVDVNSVNQTSDVKVYTALVYGNTPIDATTDFLYQAGYSWQKTESDRNVFGIGNVSADYTAKTASLDLKVMKTYKMDNALTLRPLVETTYRHYTSPSYSESTGGLDIEKFTSTQLIIGGGLIAEYKTGKNDKLIADLSVGYDLHHDDQTVTASYQGAAGVDFTTNGIDNGGWQYDIGLGYETANILGGELNFMYNYQAQGSSFDNHVLSAKYVWKF